MSHALETLLQDPRIWQARRTERADSPAHASGHATLDQLLPGGGWPCGTLTECLLPHAGIGEIRLLAPLMARLTQAGQKLFWIDPPYAVNALALAALDVVPEHLVVIRTRDTEDQIWCWEQIARSPASALTLGWADRLRTSQLRRLQLAATHSTGPTLLMRPAQAMQQASPAGLRLVLSAQPDGIRVEVIKRRGGWALPPRSIAWPGNNLSHLHTHRPAG